MLDICKTVVYHEKNKINKNNMQCYTFSCCVVMSKLICGNIAHSWSVLNMSVCVAAAVPFKGSFIFLDLFNFTLVRYCTVCVVTIYCTQ